MNMDLNQIKLIEGLFDIVLKKGDHFIKRWKNKKLNTIVNHMSDLVTNKRLYLFRIKKANDNGNEQELRKELENALRVAKEDTATLMKSIEDAKLNDSDIYKVLQTKAKYLGQTKIFELEQLEKTMTYSFEDSSAETTADITTLLSGFESQWNEISDELEKLKRKTAI